MTVLSSLPTVQFITDEDAYHYTVDNRPLSNLASRDSILAAAIDDRSITYEVFVPSSGFTKTIEATSYNFIQIIAPINNLALGGFIMPDSPVDGQIVKVISTKTVTTLTVSPNTGQSILNTPTTITNTTSFEYLYVSSLSTWFRTK